MRNKHKMNYEDRMRSILEDKGISGMKKAERMIDLIEEKRTIFFPGDRDLIVNYAYKTDDMEKTRRLAERLADTHRVSASPLEYLDLVGTTQQELNRLPDGGVGVFQVNESGFVKLKTREDEDLLDSLWDSQGRRPGAVQETAGNKSVFRVQMYDVDAYYENTSGLDAAGLHKAYLKCEKPAVDMAQYGKRISLEEYAYIEQNRLDFSVEFDADQGKAVLWDGKDFYESPIPKSGFPGRVELYGQKVMLWNENPELKLITQEVFDAISNHSGEKSLFFDYVKLSDMDFSDCHFEGVTFTGHEGFERCSFFNTEFKDCVFDEVNGFSECSMENTKMSHCKIVGTTMQNTNFDGAEISNTYFTQCNLLDNDFGNTAWKQSDITQSILEQNNFAHASFDSTFLMNNDAQGNLYEDIWKIDMQIEGIKPEEVERYRELFLKEIGGSMQTGAGRTEPKPENTAPKTRDCLEIGRDVRKAGFKSTPKIVGSIKRLDNISGKENRMKDICKAYRNGCAGLSVEERELVQAIAEECRAQQLARMMPVQ